MAIVLKAEKQILNGVNMSWNIGIVADKKLQPDKKHIDQGRIENNRCQLIQGLFADIKISDPF